MDERLQRLKRWLQHDGTASFHSLSYKDQKIRVAYREAKAYLDKTDDPIEVTLLSD